MRSVFLTLFVFFAALPTLGRSACVPSQEGYTGTGNPLDIDGVFIMQPMSLPAPGTLSDLSVLVDPGPTGSLRVALYQDNSPAAPTLLAESAPQLAVDGWNTFALPALALEPGDYWMGIQAQGTVVVQHSSPGAPSVNFQFIPWGSFPDPPALGTDFNATIAMQLGYCALPPYTPTVTPTPNPCAVQDGFGGIGNPLTLNGAMVFQPVVVTGSGSLLGLRVLLASGSTGELRGALYADGGGGPGALLTESAVIPASPAGWLNVALSPLPVAPGVYWVGLQGQNNAVVQFEAAGPADLSYVFQAWGSFPDPVPGGLTVLGLTAAVEISYCVVLPSPTPSPTSAGLSTETDTPSPTFSPTPTPTPTPFSSMTSTSIASPTFSTTATPTAVPPATATPSQTLTWTPTLTRSPTATRTPTATPTYTVTFTTTPTDTITPSVTVTPTITLTGTPVYSVTPTPTHTASPVVAGKETLLLRVVPLPQPGAKELRLELSFGATEVEVDLYTSAMNLAWRGKEGLHPGGWSSFSLAPALPLAQGLYFAKIRVRGSNGRWGEAAFVRLFMLK